MLYFLIKNNFMRKVITVVFCLMTMFGQNNNYKTKMVKNYSNEVDRFVNESFLFEMGWQLIISFEEFNREKYFDHGHFSIGWGTRAKSKYISLAQANKDSRTYYRKRIDYIKKQYPHLTLYQQYIIAAVEYNLTEARWKKALLNKIMTGENEIIVTSLVNYNKASGKTLEGLVERRKIECQYLVAENDICALEALILDTQDKIRRDNGAYIFQNVNYN